MRKLTIVEEENVKGGEAVTLTAILALMAIGIVSIICYKIFIAKGTTKISLPGGFSFQWSQTRTLPLSL